MTASLSLAKSEIFKGNQADFYTNNDVFFMTAKQLSDCLGYASKSAFDSLISRNKYLSDSEFSVTCKLQATDGKTYNTRLFTEDGIYEIAFLSRTAIAQLFRAWVRKMLKQLRLQTQQSAIPCQHIINTITKLQQDYKALSDYVFEHCHEIGNLIDRVDYLEEQQKLLPATFSTTPLIQRLVVERQDRSVHGCSTYREVYKRMYDKKTWKRLITKYKHQHSVIRANKSMIVTNDAKILTLFNQTVHTMIDELEGK